MQAYSLSEGLQRPPEGLLIASRCHPSRTQSARLDDSASSLLLYTIEKEELPSIAPKQFLAPL